MRTVFNRAECQNLKSALAREWLETNGLGGYASSTIIGANTRRYHGLLVVARRPPAQRVVLLSKFEEHLRAGTHEAYLSTNLYPGTVYPHGFNIQTEFRLRPWPTFRYACTDCEVEKSVFLVDGQNTVVVGYRVLRALGDIELRLRPLTAFRDADALTRRTEEFRPDVRADNGVISIQPVSTMPRLYFCCRPESISTDDDWYYRFTYPVEQQRGLDFEEDLFMPLEMRFRLPAGETAWVVVSTEPDHSGSASELVERELARRASLGQGTDAIRISLTSAAQAFLVRRGDTPAILAGYPWLGESGRDAMMALPGLMLSTRRFDLARALLSRYAQGADQGLIPCIYPEDGSPARVNSVDTSLWFVLACWRYWKASGDDAGTGQLLPAVRAVVKACRAGTRHPIRVNRDGLVLAGTPSRPMTWMNLNDDGYVPTSRHGNAVEVNALWLNCLLFLAEMEEKLAHDIQSAVILRKDADQVAGSFVREFWAGELGYLCDVVRKKDRDIRLRPNQILAVGLPYSPLSPGQQRSVLEIVTRELLTPYGLRTLSRKDRDYVGQYAGSARHRARACHQGTVWPWWIGTYCDAYARVHDPNRSTRKEIVRLLQPLLDHLAEGCLGSLAELFDGDSPHRAGGCSAYAVSVAEVLRVYDAYGS